MISKEKIFNFLERYLTFFTRLGISKKTPGALAVYNFIFSRTWPYGDVIEIQGSKMAVNVSDESYALKKTFEAYAANLVHEKATTELFKKTVKQGNTVVDLGANIGYFTLLSANLVGKNGKVYAFEPEPKNFSYLKKNIELNGYTQVIASQKAVSNKKGKTKLYICSYDTGHHTINQPGGIDAYRPEVKDEVKDFVEIDVLTLDELFAGRENEIDIIKMDVEGAEALALSGMDKILRINNKVKMFIEFFPMLIRQMGSSPEDFIKRLLEDYRFNMSIIHDDYNADSGSELIKVNSVADVINMTNKLDSAHINLFLERK